MTVKVGDKVRYTGVPKIGLTKGHVYDVFDVEDGLIGVYDDAGDKHYRYANQFETVTDNAKDPEYDYAEQAAKHGITITIEMVDGNVVIFDGSK